MLKLYVCAIYLWGKKDEIQQKHFTSIINVQQ
jgi:hypothetical protein